MKISKEIALILAFLLSLIIALWAYFQPGFLMDLANKFVFC